MNVPIGLVGPFAGVSGGALIAAGGQTLGSPPDQQPSDRIRILTGPDHTWTLHGQRLPEPAAYGSSVAWNDSLVCVGGSSGNQYLRGVHSIRWNSGRIELTKLPDLPEAVAHAAVAVLDDTLYVAGGEQPGGVVLRTFWALRLSTTERPASWETIEPWPGPARAAAVAGAQDGSFFVWGGRGDPNDSKNHLHDGYRYTPGSGWTSIAALPYSVARSPSPAMALGQSHIMLLAQCGMDEPRSAQGPVLLYHTITDTWVDYPLQFSDLGETNHAGFHPPSAAAPAALPFDTPLVQWQGRAVLVAGRTGAGEPTAAVHWVEPRQSATGMKRMDWLFLAVYLAAMVAIGVYFSARQVSTRSYFLADQQTPWWAAGISIFATSISALTFMAIPALVYRTDWVYFLGNMMIVFIAPVIIYFYLPFYRRLGITSAYEYLEQRFGLGARLVGSGAFLLYQLGRMGVVVYLPALALSAVTGIDIYLCIIVMGILATFYTVLGGIEAVIWTDFIQVIVLLGGALLGFGIIASQVPGGLAGIVRLGLEADKFHAVNLTWEVTTASVWVVVVGNFFKFLIPYSSDQSVVQRYLTTPDERMAARAIWTNAWMSIPAWLMFFALGTSLWAFFKTHPGELNPLGRTDEILPWFIIRELPPGLAGIVIAALFAAAMSSLDSGMNSMATAITTDFYQRFWPKSSQRASLWVARLATAAVGFAGTGFAIYMAYLESASVWNQFLKIMGLFGGGLGGLFLAGIFTRRTSSRGVLVGFGVSALALYWVEASGAVHFFLYGAVGMFTCLIAGWLASWILPDRGKDLAGLTLFSLGNAALAEAVSRRGSAGDADGAKG